MDAPQKPSKPKEPPFQRRRFAEHELIDEIAAAARRLAEARDSCGQSLYRTDGVWRVLTTVARSHYCLAIADLARALKIRKQAAHELAHAAARTGVIELATNHQDRRLLQVLLTPRGRAELAAARSAETRWLLKLAQRSANR